MVSIELLKLKMHAFHGIYEGERKTGSEYELNIKVNFDEGGIEFHDLGDTINYGEIFTIVKQCMQIPTPLLEKVADTIIRAIKQQYPEITEVILSIYKLQAPLENFNGKIGVTLHKRFNE